MQKHVLFPILLIAALFTAPACKKQNTSTPSSSSSGSTGTNEVLMQNNSFSPANLTVAVNATVKWTNKDGVGHNVTSNNGEFSSGTISNGGTFSHQFTAVGAYPYRCTIHSNMTGTITVQ